MNRLQKSAWLNLVVVAGCVLISGLGFAVLTQFEANGIINLLIFCVAGCFIVPAFYVFYHRWSIEAGFDEREKIIYRRAFILAARVAIVFLAGICIVPFFILGADSVIRTYYLPAMFLSTLLTTQFAHSMSILSQCLRDETDQRS